MSNPTSNSAPDTSEHQDTWNELAELAAITGYKAEPPPGKRMVSEHPLLDDADLNEQETNEQTQTPLWSNPLAKTGVVAGLTAIAFGSIGLFVASLNGTWNKHAHDPKPLAADQAQNVTNSDQAEIARLKTVTALGNQAQIIKQAPKNSGVVVSSRKPTIKASRVYKQPAVVAQTPRYLPTPVPSFRSFTPYTPSVTRSNPVSSIPSTPTHPLDPNQAWQKAMALGSFGSDEGSGISSSVERNETLSESVSAVGGTAPETQLVSSQARYEVDESALLSGEARRVVSLFPGTTAAAILSTPVVWAQDLKPEQQPQKFGLQLSEPLHAADGSVAVPAGSQMVAKVDAASNNGLMQLSVISIVSPTSKGNQVTEIPAGVITVTAAEGRPLVAENQNPQRRGLFGKDLSVTLMGALGQVGSLLNRPSNQTTMTSPYLSTTSITNGNTNVLGGVLEGSFGKLVDRVSARQQREIDEILKRPNLWYIPAGKPLMIFTNSAMEIGV
jgi:hypothetical protein